MWPQAQYENSVEALAKSIKLLIETLGEQCRDAALTQPRTLELLAMTLGSTCSPLESAGASMSYAVIARTYHDNRPIHHSFSTPGLRCRQHVSARLFLEGVMCRTYGGEESDYVRLLRRIPDITSDPFNNAILYSHYLKDGRS